MSSHRKGATDHDRTLEESARISEIIPTKRQEIKITKAEMKLINAVVRFLKDNNYNAPLWPEEDILAVLKSVEPPMSELAAAYYIIDSKKQPEQWQEAGSKKKDKSTKPPPDENNKSRNINKSRGGGGGGGNQRNRVQNNNNTNRDGRQVHDKRLNAQGPVGRQLPKQDNVSGDPSSSSSLTQANQRTPNNISNENRGSNGEKKQQQQTEVPRLSYSSVAGAGTVSAINKNISATSGKPQQLQSKPAEPKHQPPAPQKPPMGAYSKALMTGITTPASNVPNGTTTAQSKSQPQNTSSANSEVTTAATNETLSKQTLPSKRPQSHLSSPTTSWKVKQQLPQATSPTTSATTQQQENREEESQQVSSQPPQQPTETVPPSTQHTSSTTPSGSTTTTKPPSGTTKVILPPSLGSAFGDQDRLVLFGGAHSATKSQKTQPTSTTPVPATTPSSSTTTTTTTTKVPSSPPNKAVKEASTTNNVAQVQDTSSANHGGPSNLPAMNYNPSFGGLLPPGGYQLNPNFVPPQLHHQLPGLYPLGAPMTPGNTGWGMGDAHSQAAFMMSAAAGGLDLNQQQQLAAQMAQLRVGPVVPPGGGGPLGMGYGGGNAGPGSGISGVAGDPNFYPFFGMNNLMGGYGIPPQFGGAPGMGADGSVSNQQSDGSTSSQQSSAASNKQQAGERSQQSRDNSTGAKSGGSTNQQSQQLTQQQQGTGNNYYNPNQQAFYGGGSGYPGAPFGNMPPPFSGSYGANQHLMQGPPPGMMGMHGGPIPAPSPPLPGPYQSNVTSAGSNSSFAARNQPGNSNNSSGSAGFGSNIYVSANNTSQKSQQQGSGYGSLGDEDFIPTKIGQGGYPMDYNPMTLHGAGSVAQFQQQHQQQGPPGMPQPHHHHQQHLQQQGGSGGDDSTSQTGSKQHLHSNNSNINGGYGTSPNQFNLPPDMMFAHQDQLSMMHMVPPTAGFYGSYGNASGFMQQQQPQQNPQGARGPSNY